jgi:structural maintenance of chromosome 1
LNKVSRLKSHYLFTPNSVLQANKTHENLLEKIQGLESVVNEAEDGVFAEFCEQIGVEDIREYEERQLKVAQEVSEARLRFETQIARLSTQ